MEKGMVCAPLRGVKSDGGKLLFTSVEDVQEAYCGLVSVQSVNYLCSTNLTQQRMFVLKPFLGDLFCWSCFPFPLMNFTLENWDDLLLSEAACSVPSPSWRTRRLWKRLMFWESDACVLDTVSTSVADLFVTVFAFRQWHGWLWNERSFVIHRHIGILIYRVQQSSPANFKC